MEKVVKFESSNQRRSAIEAAACAWLARLEAGASDEELKTLSAWLFESKEHVEVFFEVSAAWDQLSILSELSEVFPLEKYKRRASGKKRRWTGAAAIASLAVVLVVAVSAVSHDFVSWMRTDSLVAATTYKTDVGQRSTVTLPDGSEIVLNTNTLIEVRYSGTERRIVLDKGEALFTVTKDSLRPFRVVVGTHVVEAIGTAFTVQKTFDNSVEVMVKEGVVGFKSLGEVRNSVSQSAAPVSVRGLEDSISVAAGEVLISEGQDGETIEKQNLPLEAIETKLSWQYGMLFFLDEPLDRVITEINRYTTTVIVTDEAVRGIRVDGSFRVGDVDALLLAMRENFGIQVVELGNGNIYLSRANAN